MPLDALNVPAVARERAFLSALFESPNLDGRVIASRGKPSIIWTEAQASYGFPRARPLPGGQVVHIGLEVFDDAALVRGCEVSTGMGELHSTYPGIMRL